MDYLFARGATINEPAILVDVNFRNDEFNEATDEFIDLVTSAGLVPINTITCSRPVPDPRFFIGKGKVEQVKAAVRSKQAEVIIFNHALNPGQERNLEQECQCRVVDRVGLILDIFAQRARSFEGKLQVELAQLKYLSTRLIRGWTHLERQKGGIGLRGPGETQLETDRRLIGKRIKTITARLKKVRSQRQQSRKRRSRASMTIVSLIGYTNAGKSTLFNRLTGASVLASDKLFVTLDPIFRRMEHLATPIILTDTVGFIRHIPHDLIAAFHATLEETRAADLLLHVVDINSDHRQAQTEQVNQVLTEIGAETIPQIIIYNKIDLYISRLTKMVADRNGTPHKVWVSAKTGAGIDTLLNAISHCLRDKEPTSLPAPQTEKWPHRASWYKSSITG